MELTLSGHRFETFLIYLVDVTVFMRKSLQKPRILGGVRMVFNLLEISLNRVNVCCLRSKSVTFCLNVAPRRTNRPY